MELNWTKTVAAWIAINPEVDADHQITTQDRPNEQVQELSRRLLKIGGQRVSIWFDDERLAPYILDMGEIAKYQTLQLEEGEERECHENSVKIWRKNPVKYRIMTGYALSEDGIWRRHTWLLTNEEELIETTIKREIYFGCILKLEVAEAFTISNFE